MLMEKAQITSSVRHENVNAGLCIAAAADVLRMKSKNGGRIWQQHVCSRFSPFTL